MSILRGPAAAWLSKALTAVSENGHHLPKEAKPHSPCAPLVISIVEAEFSYHKVLKMYNSIL